MIDLKANTCPNREQRAGAINAYYASERTWARVAGGTIQNKSGNSSRAPLRPELLLTTRVVHHPGRGDDRPPPVGCSSSSLLYREV